MNVVNGCCVLLGMNITISRLDRPERYGDWHDKPLKWQVLGPATEVQKFSTRKEAELYARLRRKTDQPNAIRLYVAS